MRHVADVIQTKRGKVKDGRVARRVTTLPPRGRTTGDPLVVTLTPEGIYLREPRRRTAFLLPYDVAYTSAARLTVEAARHAKLATRKRRRKGRRKA